MKIPTTVPIDCWCGTRTTIDRDPAITTFTCPACHRSMTLPNIQRRRRVTAPQDHPWLPTGPSARSITVAKRRNNPKRHILR